MMNYKYLRGLLLAIVYMFGLFGIIASGGSSSSSDDDEVTTSGSKSASLKGTAAKGIVIMGNVAADELDVNGAILRRVGDAVTGTDGSYSLILNNTYQGGPILITITNGPNTTTVCDATSGCGTRTDGLPDDLANVIDFGEEYKPVSLSMKALVPDAQAGESIDTQVTPFTHMAADRALAGPVDSVSVARANSEVSDLLGGVDILRAEPVDITDPASFADADAVDVTYAALAAAILEIAADDANGQPDIDAVLLALSNDFTLGTFPADDMQVILDEAVDALAQVGAIDTSGVIAAIQDDVTTAGVGGDLDPEPNPNAGDTDVELAKSFISDLRTWGTVIGDELDAPSEAFETQLDMAAEVSNFIFDTAEEDAISAGVDCIDALFDGIPGADVLTDCVTEYGSFTEGTISEATTANGVEYTIANASFTNLSADVSSLSMVLVAPEDGATVTTIVFGVQSIVAEGDVSRWVVNSGTVTLNLAAPYTLDYDLDDPPNPEVVSVSLDFDLAATQKKTVVNNVLVDATDPVTVSANFSTTIYTLSDGNNEILDGIPGSFEVGGTISNSTGDSFDASFTVSIPTASDDATTPIGPVYDLGSTYDDNNDPVNPGDHLIEWEYTGGPPADTFTYRNPEIAYQFIRNPNGSVDVFINSIFILQDPGPYASINDFVVPNFFPDFNYGSYWIDGQGEYERSDGFFEDYSMDGFVEFTLSEVDVEFYDGNNPVIGSVGLQFTAQFAGLPEADISITANATGFEEVDEGNATVIISYGLRRLEFYATRPDTPDPDSGSVEITNQDGVVMLVVFNDLDDDASINDITINGGVVATVQDVGFGTKITYIDGTFEIF